MLPLPPPPPLPPSKSKWIESSELLAAVGAEWGRMEANALCNYHQLEETRTRHVDNSLDTPK